MIGKRTAQDFDPARPQHVEEPFGVADTGDGMDRRAGERAERPHRPVTQGDRGLRLEAHAERAPQQRTSAVDDDGIRGPEAPRRLAKRPCGQQPAIAEAAVAVDHHHLAIPRQRIVLQAIVAHDDVATVAGQQLRGRRAIATDGHRCAGAPGQQNGFVAHHAGIVGRRDAAHVSR